MLTFRARRWRGRDLAVRLCQLIYGDTSVHVDDDGRRLHIGVGNDWWLHPLGNERYRLVYRYPTTARMDALAITLEWLLGAEIEEGPSAA